MHRHWDTGIKADHTQGYSRRHRLDDHELFDLVEGGEHTTFAAWAVIVCLFGWILLHLIFLYTAGV